MSEDEYTGVVEGVGNSRLYKKLEEQVQKDKELIEQLKVTCVDYENEIEDKEELLSGIVEEYEKIRDKPIRTTNFGPVFLTIYKAKQYLEQHDKN